MPQQINFADDWIRTLYFVVRSGQQLCHLFSQYLFANYKHLFIWIPWRSPFVSFHLALTV